MSHGQANHRRHRRYRAEVPVRISTIDAEQDPWNGRPFFRAISERSADISRGGLFVRTNEPIAPGRRVLLEIDFPEGSTMQAVGRVAWSRRVLGPTGIDEDTGIGVQFLGASREQAAELDRFLAGRGDSGSGNSDQDA